MRKFGWILMLIFLPFISEAGNQASGYISLKNMGGTTYQATFYDYTLGLSCNVPATDTIRIWWGDGTSELLYLSNGSGDSVCNCRAVNYFVGTHTYPGPGNYTIWVDAIARVADINNIMNSVNTDMFIFNKLTISPLGGSTPIVTNPPICTSGCPGQCYTFNLNAYSPSGDSLSYLLGDCLSGGTISPGYTSLNAIVNPVTGNLSWCNPPSEGLWSFSISIITHRNTFIDSVAVSIPVDTEEVELQVTVDSACLTGINEIKNKGAYSIYPNPSNGRFTLKASGALNSSVVEIYNMLGEKVFTQSLSRVDTPLDLSNSTSGVYVYMITTNMGNFVSEGKFIIQK